MKPNKWNTILTENDVLDIIEKSVVKPQIIFKDSVTCGISAFAKERLIDGYGLIENEADFNYLDLLSYRAISNFIAAKLEVIPPVTTSYCFDRPESYIQGFTS